VSPRRALQGMGIGIIGLSVALAPMTVASAHSKKPKHKSSHHSTSSKGGTNPGSAFCKDLKAEEASDSGLGVSIEKALEGGNFNSAKGSIEAAFNNDLKQFSTANGLISNAPSNVQAAFKQVYNFVKQIESDIAGANSLPALETSFESLGQNTKFTAAGTTLENYVTTQCGSVAPATPTT
jgi:hypothetical protein